MINTEFTKSEIVELLKEDKSVFDETIAKAALEQRIINGNILHACAMLGFTNYCKNRCLYCGMSALCKVPRYRIDDDDVILSAKNAFSSGFRRIFLVAGEDPKYGFDNILKIVNGIKSTGMHLTLACGEFERSQYFELKDAGCDSYVVKFEMSDPEIFNRLNPSTSFEKRMQSIQYVKESGMELGSGNIVDFPGQTLESLADDILLMKTLGISWAPVIPYLPVPETPLASGGGRGSIELNLREISILRVMMPNILITAQQPGENMKNGLGDEQGNLAALKAGADILFADLLPNARAKAFRVVNDRKLLGCDHIVKMASLSGMVTDIYK